MSFSWETIGALIGGLIITWLTIHDILERYNKKHIMNELKPNGGSSLRDVVDRIEKNQLLTLERSRAFVSEVELLLFECDKDGECIWVNRRYLDVVKRTSEDIFGSGWIMCVAPHDRKRVYDEWLSSVKAGIFSDIEYTLISSDGQKYKVAGRSFPLKVNDVVEGFVGSIKIL